MLVMKYNRKDFFGNPVYAEDKKQNHDKSDLKKAFLFMGRTYEATVQIDGMVIFWDCLTEYENRVISVRNYDGMNYTEAKKSYDQMKKECYAMV